jgi:tetratricopeptide (TPR) repeat protein
MEIHKGIWIKERIMNKAKPHMSSKRIPILFVHLSRSLNSEEKSDDHNDQSYPIKRTIKAFRKISAHYGGACHLITRSKTVILFGHPSSHEDDTERALFAALEIRKLVHQFNEEHGTRLAIRCGIDTMNLKANDLQCKQTATINEFAQTMKSILGRTGEGIIVSDTIYQRTAYLFQYKPIRGTQGPPRYRLIGVRETPGLKHGIRELSSPLVGRKRETRILQKALKSITAREAHVVTISGEAGIGKSRFINEFRNLTGGDVTWLSGRCSSYERVASFSVFLEQIRSYLGVGDFDEEKENTSTPDGTAQKLFTAKKDDYLPYLSVFLSMKVLEHLNERVKYLDPKSLRLQEFVSVKAFFRDLARKKPLILYFEDTQWIDAESLELLQFLLDGLRDSPILFLFETRPERDTGIYTIPDTIERKYKKQKNELTLKPLTSNETKAFAKHLLNMVRVPPHLAELLYVKSEGNPFFIEEILRSLIRSGVLQRDNGSWRLARQPSAVGIPDTIESVIKSRIDILPFDIKEVLGRASVIGKRFPYRLLSGISKKNELKSKLGYLEYRDFITKRNGKKALKTDVHYIFRHILTRDVAYQGLPSAYRKDIHKQVAQWVEKNHKRSLEAHFGVLAYHYELAAMLRKAYEYYVKAGNRAKERFENNASIEFYSQAIKIHRTRFPVRRKKELKELHLNISKAKQLMGQYTVALGELQSAFRLCKNKKEKVTVLLEMAVTYMQSAKNNEAAQLFEQVIGNLKHIPDKKLRSEALLKYAHFKAEIECKYAEAEAMIKKALGGLDAKKEQAMLGNGLITMGNIFRMQGKLDKALKCIEKSLRIYDKYDDKLGLAMGLANATFVLHDMGKNELAMKYAKKTLKLSEETGYYQGVGMNYAILGNIYYAKGEIENALRSDKKSLAMGEELGHKRMIGIALCNMGTVYSTQGKIDAALAHFSRYLAISNDIGYVKGQMFGCGNVGILLIITGELQKSLHYLQRYLRMSKKAGYKSGVMKAYRFIAEVYMLRGKSEPAMKHLKIAERLSVDLGNLSMQSSISSCRSELAGMQHDYEQAVIYGQKALHLARKGKAKLEEIESLRILGIALSRWDFQRSKKTLAESISLAKACKHQLKAAAAMYELARVLMQNGERKAAKGFAKKAHSFFKTSGLSNWIAKTDYLLKDLVSS